MNLFFYIPQKNSLAKRLVEISDSLQPYGLVKSMRTFRQLQAGLRRPLDDRDVVILYLPTRRHLEELAIVKPFLERVRVIVILPDTNPETIALGHQLRPRFLTIADQRFEDLAAVLKKMGEAARPAA